MGQTVRNNAADYLGASLLFCLGGVGKLASERGGEGTGGREGGEEGVEEGRARGRGGVGLGGWGGGGRWWDG